MSIRVADLPTLWRQRAKDLRPFATDKVVQTIESLATELEEAIVEAELEALTLAEAAEESGLSYGHLSRLVNEGAIPNAGQKGSPRIRRRDLPRRVRRAS